MTLEGAPRGRLSAFVDATARIRLFYETADPLACGDRASGRSHGKQCAALHRPISCGSSTPAGSVIATPVRFVPPQPQGRLRYKTFRNGAWAESHPLLGLPNVAQGDPAAVELPPLPDGSRPIWLAWIDNPYTNAARLRFARGTARTPQPARYEGSAANRSGLFRAHTSSFAADWPEAKASRLPNGFSRPATCRQRKSRRC